MPCSSLESRASASDGPLRHLLCLALLAIYLEPCILRQFLGVQLLRPPFARDEALWSLQHHHDEEDAVEQELVFGELAEQIGEDDEDQGTESHPGDAPHATNDDDHEDSDRDDDVEGMGKDRADLSSEE